eukprot:3264180-Prymnesium_polylepis.2
MPDGCVLRLKKRVHAPAHSGGCSFSMVDATKTTVIERCPSLPKLTSSAQALKTSIRSIRPLTARRWRAPSITIVATSSAKSPEWSTTSSRVGADGAGSGALAGAGSGALAGAAAEPLGAALLSAFGGSSATASGAALRR